MRRPLIILTIGLQPRRPVLASLEGEESKLTELTLFRCKALITIDAILTTECLSVVIKSKNWQQLTSLKMWLKEEIGILGENNGTSVSQICKAFYDQNKNQKEWR